MYSASPGGRASPADFTAAVTSALVAPCAPDQECPAPPEDSGSSDFALTLYFAIPGGRRQKTCSGCVGAVLCTLWMPSCTNRLCCCCSGGTGRACCAGPRQSSFTFATRLCDFESCRGAVHRKPRRPSFTNSLHDCCSSGTVHAICSGPRRPSFTRGPFDFRFCRGTVLLDPKRPSFTNRPFDCCEAKPTCKCMMNERCQNASRRTTCFSIQVCTCGKEGCNMQTQRRQCTDQA